MKKVLIFIVCTITFSMIFASSLVEEIVDGLDNFQHYTPRKRKIGEPLRVLVLEGGGVRMIVQAVILSDVERRTKKPISSLFDLLVGSSAGATVAARASITMPGNLMDEFVENYSQLAAVGFKSPPLCHKLTSLWGYWGQKYQNRSLFATVQQYGQDIKLSHPLVPIVIPIYDVGLKRIVLMRSQDAKKNPENDFYLRDVTAGAMAFPGMFSPVRMSPIGLEHERSRSIVVFDAGPYVYNPALIALQEAAKMLKKEDAKIILKLKKLLKSNDGDQVNAIKLLLQKEYRIKMLDIGSGAPESWLRQPERKEVTENPRTGGIVRNLTNYIAMMFQGLRINPEEGIKAFFGEALQTNYCRLLTPLKRDSDGRNIYVTDSNDPVIVEALIKQTQDYLKTPEYINAIKGFFGDELLVD